VGVAVPFPKGAAAVPAGAVPVKLPGVRFSTRVAVWVAITSIVGVLIKCNAYIVLLL